MVPHVIQIVGRHTYMIAALFYGAAALVVLATDQGLWADGGFFAFVAAQDDPWGMFWRDFPARAGGGLITTLPAWIAGRLGLETTAVALVYQATYLALPLVGLAWAWRLLPADYRDWMAPAVLFWAAVAMPSFTFPTELWVSAALFWPIFFAVLFPAGRAAQATRLALTPLLLFTHEAVALLVPVLLFAAWRPMMSAGRREQLLFSAVLVLSAAAMAAVALTAVPANALQVRAVAGNSGHFLSPKPFLRVPLMSGGAAVLGLFLLGARLSERRTVENLAAVAAMLIAVLTYMAANGAVFPYGHYLARVGIAFLLPAFAAALLAFRHTVRFDRTLAVLFLVPLLIAQTVYQLRVNDAWRTYRGALLATLSHPPAQPLVDIAATPVAALSGTPRKETNFVWRWALPYQSLTLSLPAERTAVVFDPTMWFVPLRCDHKDLLRYRGALAPDVLPAIGRHLCARNP